MAEHLSRQRNRSASFQALIHGVEDLWQDLRREHAACE